MSTYCMGDPWGIELGWLAKHLDHLLTILPFEKKYFEKTSLPVTYVGHPLVEALPSPTSAPKDKILALFPGSRAAEIRRNLPLQIEAAKKLQEKDPGLTVYISDALGTLAPQIYPLVPKKDTEDLMQKSRLAIATSGTITLELALRGVPTVVTYWIRPFDEFCALKIFRIHLDYYCLVNLILGQEAFPELFGSRLTKEALFYHVERLWFEEKLRRDALTKCKLLFKILKGKRASFEAASRIEEFLDI